MHWLRVMSICNINLLRLCCTEAKLPSYFFMIIVEWKDEEEKKKLLKKVEGKHPLMRDA